MQQSGIFRNEKLHEYRYPASVCYNHGGKKCQKYVKITAKILIIYVMIITWIPTPVRNVPAWYALLPKIMTNGKITEKFLILSLKLQNDRNHSTIHTKSTEQVQHPRQENVQTNDSSEVLSVLSTTHHLKVRGL